MSASPKPEFDAIASRIATALERYEADVGRLIETWPDMDLYASVSDEVERIRRHGAALPGLSMPWVELLIAHTELVHCLWRARFSEAQPSLESLRRCRERHSRCIGALRTALPADAPARLTSE